MAHFNVTVPIVTSMTYFGVEADSPEDAINHVLTNAAPRIELRHGGSDDVGDDCEFGTFEWVRHATQGNVFYGEVNEAFAEPDDAYEDVDEG